MGSTRVLLIDDDNDVHVIVKALLEPQGFTVEAESSSDAGLIRLLGEPWHVALIDFRIDRRNGLELVREARAGGCIAPVLMLTGSSTVSTEREAMEQGFTQFIEKRELTSSSLSRHIRWAIDHHRTLQALARSNQELARSVDELERFAGVVGHDLRGPMHRIATTLELLDLRFAADLGDEGSQMIGRTIRAVNDLGELVDDLLAYARLNDVKFAEVPLDACMDRALAAHEDILVERGGKVEHSELGTLRGSRTHLTQLLQNLVGNALKFSPQDAPVVRVSGREQGAFYVLEVADEGIGIDPDHQQRIFEMFHRLHRDSDYPGTGIGLATCAKVAAIHGGRIEVDSTPGEGSTFRVYLALRPPEPLNPQAWSATRG